MRKNILLIDESLTIHKIVELTIEKQNYQLFNAYNAEEGVEQAASEEMDCILIDVLIINEDHLYLEKLRATSPKAKMIPLVSTFKQFQEVSKEFPFIIHHIVKPFNAPALNLVLEIASRRGELVEDGKADANEKSEGEGEKSEGEKSLSESEKPENSAETSNEAEKTSVEGDTEKPQDEPHGEADKTDSEADKTNETEKSSVESEKPDSEAEKAGNEGEISEDKAATSSETEKSESEKTENEPAEAAADSVEKEPIQNEEPAQSQEPDQNKDAQAADSEGEPPVSESSKIPMVYQEGYGDIPVNKDDSPGKDDLVITDVFSGKKEEPITRNDIIVNSIEQDLELEILQEFMEKSEEPTPKEKDKEGEEEEEVFAKDIYSYQDIDIPPANGDSVPDVSTVIDIMDKVIATENIDRDLGKLELELADEAFDNKNDEPQAASSLLNYGDVDVDEEAALTERDEPSEALSEQAREEDSLSERAREEESESESESGGVEVELEKTGDEAVSSETKERQEILGLFPSDEKSGQPTGFKRIAESNIPDKAPTARLYFELPKEEFVELFKRYLDKNTIDFLLHDTVQSVLEKILSEVLEKAVRKELERIIKGS